MKISPNSYKGFVPNSNQPILSPQLQPRYRPMGLMARDNIGKNLSGFKNLQPIELNFNYSNQKHNFPEQKLNIRNLPVFSKFDSSENIPIINSNAEKNIFKTDNLTKKEMFTTFVDNKNQLIYVDKEKRQIPNINNRYNYVEIFIILDFILRIKKPNQRIQLLNHYLITLLVKI